MTSCGQVLPLIENTGGGSPAPVTTATSRPAVTSKHRGEECVREDPTKGDPGVTTAANTGPSFTTPTDALTPAKDECKHESASSRQRQSQMRGYAHENDKHKLEPTQTVHSPYDNDERNGDGTGAQVSSPLPSNLPTDSPCTAGKPPLRWQHNSIT